VEQLRVVLQQLEVLVEKMLKVVKMQKVIKKLQQTKVEKVLQEKVAKKEQKKLMNHLLKVRCISTIYFYFNLCV
jgi:hypothetical protein